MKRSRLSTFNRLFPWLALTAFIVLLFGGVVWRASTGFYYVASGSMEPTLAVGDRFFVDKRAYGPAAPAKGDVTVFKPPRAMFQISNLSGDVDFVMRVVGVPGERVEFVNGALRVNGKMVAEPYANWNQGQYDLKIVSGKVYSRDRSEDELAIWTQGLVSVADQSAISAAVSGVVPPDKFLVLGDNRGNSNDSHVWGFVPRENFIGRVSSIFSPLERRRSF